MHRWDLVSFVAGWVLLGVASYILEKRAKQAARENEPYISPLNGMVERVPSSLKVSQYLLWATAAAVVATVYISTGKYLLGVPYFIHIVIAFYCAWVYWRGREPKIMEGFREIPDPPSLWKKP